MIKNVRYRHEKVNRIVDMETGEVVRQIAIEDTAYGQRYYNKDRGYKYRGRSWRMIRMSTDIPMPDEMSPNDIGRLYMLSRYIYFGAGMLATYVNHRIKPLNKAGIIEKLGLTTRKNGNAMVNKLMRLQLLRKTMVVIDPERGTAEEQWFINPLYFAPVYINRTLYILWRDQIEKYIPDYVRDIFDKEE